MAAAQSDNRAFKADTADVPMTDMLIDICNLSLYTAARAESVESQDTMAHASPDKTSKPAATTGKKNDELALERLAEELFVLHMKYSGNYITENPITGRSGEFHLSSTGHKVIAEPPPPLAKQPPGISNQKLHELLCFFLRYRMLLLIVKGFENAGGKSTQLPSECAVQSISNYVAVSLWRAAPAAAFRDAIN
ncbi:hypothetical protein G7046_g2901 [Stylonectria norvegica]|nr:hypothetical protein G7046_g2901 [Stylonectria norvegica]